MRTRRTTDKGRRRFEPPRTPRDAGNPVPPNPRKDLIRLNTSSLRKKALAEHRKAEGNLSQLKDQLKRYHEKDIPGFRSWVHRAFGPLLTRQRELQQAIEEKRTFVLELHTLASRYRLSEVAAYRKVLWRRAHPDEAQAEDLEFEEAERQRQEARAKDAPAGDIFDDDDPELSDLFDETKFDDVPDDQWDDFSDFVENMTGVRPPAREAQRPPPEQKSVKEVYRTIVRRLHPDHHGQMTEARKALWHEAQEAYRRRDLNALHSVLTRCGDGEAGLGSHSPVSLIRGLTRQLKAAAQAARREMRDMQREVAWDYETRRNNPRYVREVRTDLEDIVRDLQWRLDEVSRELAHIDRRARQPLSRRRPHPPSPRDEFLF